MALSYADVGRFGFVDFDRLIDDLSQSWADSRDRAIRPPLSSLAELGRAFLHASAGSPEAMKVQLLPDLTQRLRAIVFGDAFERKVPVSLLIVACIAARSDLLPQFRTSEGKFSLDAGIEWFVLHGANEHRLWHLADDDFVHALSKKTPGSSVRPIDRILCAERPEWRQAASINSPAYASWFQEAVKQYKMDWCLPALPQATISQYLLNSAQSLAGDKYNRIASLFLKSARRTPIYFDADMLLKGMIGGTAGESGSLAGIKIYSPTFDILLPTTLLAHSRLVLEFQDVGDRIDPKRINVSIDKNNGGIRVIHGSESWHVELDTNYLRNNHPDGGVCVNIGQKVVSTDSESDGWTIIRRLWQL